MNMVVTNNDTGGVVLIAGTYNDELLTFAGAGTVLAGTILARNTASGKMVPFVKGGSGGDEIPLKVIEYAVTATGAGDIPVRPMSGGQVLKSRLVIDADGDDSNIDVVVKDQLLDYGMTVVESQNLSVLGNQ